MGGGGMSEVTLVKQLPLELNEADAAVMRRVLFESVGGLSERDQKGWRRFWNQIKRAEPGEVFSIETWFPRVGAYHRRHMPSTAGRRSPTTACATRYRPCRTKPWPR